MTSEGREYEDDDEELESGQQTQYRAIVARALYLCQDRSDIQYATKELSRRMSNPKVKDLRNLKRLGRYLIGRESNQ
jgi:hypothetical protein